MLEAFIVLFPPTFFVLPSLAQHHDAFTFGMKTVISGARREARKYISNSTTKHGK